MQKFALICDLHIDTADPALAHLDPRRNAVRLLDALKRDGLRKVIAMGDVSDSDEGLLWFIGELDKRGFDFSLMPGNHDVFESFRETGIVRGPTAYSAARMEGFKVLFLDTSAYSVDAEQLAWMEAELRDNHDDILLFVHHPIIDCGDTQMDRLYPLKNREKTLDAIAGRPFNVTLFCGHYHTESAVRLGNVVQFVTPSVLYQIKKHTVSPHLEIADERIGFRVLEIDGTKTATEVRYLDPEPAPR